MKRIKPNSIEAVMFFALYICAQDKKIAKEENELILDIQVIRKLYFDIYGEFIDDNFKEVIHSVNINDDSIKPLISDKLQKKKETLCPTCSLIQKYKILQFLLLDTQLQPMAFMNLKRKSLIIG